jgi:hypothetical protein
MVVCKTAARCAQSQSRFMTRTSSAFFYVVAHKTANKFHWNKTPSGFLHANVYPPASSVITGIAPPRKASRLCDFDNAVLRPQVGVHIDVTHRYNPIYIY